MICFSHFLLFHVNFRPILLFELVSSQQASLNRNSLIFSKQKSNSILCHFSFTTCPQPLWHGERKQGCIRSHFPDRICSFALHLANGCILYAITSCSYTTRLVLSIPFLRTIANFYLYPIRCAEQHSFSSLARWTNGYINVALNLRFIYLSTFHFIVAKLRQVLKHTMGKLIKHQWARLIALTAGACTIITLIHTLTLSRSCVGCALGILFSKSLLWHVYTVFRLF
jgi:hypothetical protein